LAPAKALGRFGDRLHLINLLLHSARWAGAKNPCFCESGSGAGGGGVGGGNDSSPAPGENVENGGLNYGALKINKNPLSGLFGLAATVWYQSLTRAEKTQRTLSLALGLFMLGRTSKTQICNAAVGLAVILGGNGPPLLAARGRPRDSVFLFSFRRQRAG